MDDLRKRVPFKFNAEDSREENNPVLDEQEQEELISGLRNEAEKANKGFLRALQVLSSLSCFMHIIFFFDLTLLREPPIVLARLFVLIQVLVHARLLFLLTPMADTTFHQLVRNIPQVFFSTPLFFAVSCLAPLASVTSRKTWQQTGWWSVAPLMLCVVQVVLHWMKEGDEHIGGLETLRYDAKGA